MKPVVCAFAQCPSKGQKATLFLLTRCPNCPIVYCSEKCQKKDTRNHSEICMLWSHPFAYDEASVDDVTATVSVVHPSGVVDEVHITKDKMLDMPSILSTEKVQVFGISTPVSELRIEMVVSATSDDLPYNAVASQIAETEVRGSALILNLRSNAGLVAQAAETETEGVADAENKESSVCYSGQQLNPMRFRDVVILRQIQRTKPRVSAKAASSKAHKSKATIYDPARAVGAH
eukprot:Colp12_sorted_trinity150504_noHs@21807